MNELLSQDEIWFVTGSQHLYGAETLSQVADHAKEISKALNDIDSIKTKILYKGVVTTSDSIRQLCLLANSEKACVGSDHLDAYFLSCKNVDRWSTKITKTTAPFSYPI